MPGRCPENLMRGIIINPGLSIFYFCGSVRLGSPCFLRVRSEGWVQTLRGLPRDVRRQGQRAERKLKIFPYSTKAKRIQYVNIGKIVWIKVLSPSCIHFNQFPTVLHGGGGASSLPTHYSRVMHRT